MTLSQTLENFLSSLHDTFKDNSRQLITQFSDIISYLNTQPSTQNWPNSSDIQVSTLHNFFKNIEFSHEAIIFRTSKQRAFLILHAYPAAGYNSKESLTFIEFNPNPELTLIPLPTLNELKNNRYLGNLATISSLTKFSSSDTLHSEINPHREQDLILLIKLIEQTHSRITSK